MFLSIRASLLFAASALALPNPSHNSPTYDVCSEAKEHHPTALSTSCFSTTKSRSSSTPAPSPFAWNATSTKTPLPTSSTSTVTLNSSALTSASASVQTAPYGSPVAPKVLLIANTFEFTYLKGYNFTTRYTGPLLDHVFACTSNGETCMLACGQELVSAAQITALVLIPGIDLTRTYIFITGTGGVNPKYGTAGGVAISKYSVQWEWGGVFLGADLPANFSGQYFFSYAQDAPYKYPSLVGSEV
ncbi:hypothetical protein LTR66_008969, partial [Elasticomyces elasticus]